MSGMQVRILPRTPTQKVLPDHLLLWRKRAREIFRRHFFLRGLIIAVQKELADWLGVSTAAVSKCIKQWGVNIEDMDLKSTIQLFYRQQSEIASNRQGMADGEVYDLVVERAKTERMKQEDLRLRIQEKSRELVPAEEFRLALVPIMQAVRTNVLAIPGKVVQQAKALKGIDLEIEFIEDIVYDALKSCAEIDVRSIVDSVLNTD